MMFNNTLLVNDEYAIKSTMRNKISQEYNNDLISPIKCTKLIWTSYVFIILFLVSFGQNSFLLYKFYLNKKLRSSYHVLIIALISFNFIGSILIYPVVIVSCFKCKWVFKEFGCNLTSLIVLFIASLSIYIMTLISLERFLTVKYSLKRFSIQPSKIKLTIFFSSLLSLFWSILPMFGYSHYKLEPTLISCSVDWTDKSFKSTVYIVNLFLFVYFIPLLVIFGTNFNTILIVSI
jgi:hypothetical protein